MCPCADDTTATLVASRFAKHCHKLFVLKVGISHLRYLSALCFLRLSYSEGITWGLHVMNWVSTLLIPDLPLTCVGVSDSVYVKALIGSLLLPGLLLCTLGLHLIRPFKLQEHQSRILASSLLWYAPYISLFTSMPLLACQEADSQPLLFLEMDVACWQGLHIKYVRLLVLPSLLLTLIGPIAVVLVFRLFRPTLFCRYFPL